MSRKSKLTAEVHAQICNLLRAGMYLEVAAAKARVGRQTVYDWMSRGKAESEGIYREFYEAVEEAQADDEARSVITLQQLGARSISVDCKNCGGKVKVPVPDRVALNAVTWKLERKFPDRYGGKIKIQVEGKVKDRVESIMEMLQSGLSTEEYSRVIDVLCRASDIAELVEEATGSAEEAEQGLH